LGFRNPALRPHRLANKYNFVRVVKNNKHSIKRMSVRIICSKMDLQDAELVAILRMYWRAGALETGDWRRINSAIFGMAHEQEASARWR
jgi:hypothetical protein